MPAKGLTGWSASKAMARVPVAHPDCRMIFGSMCVLVPGLVLGVGSRTGEGESSGRSRHRSEEGHEPTLHSVTTIMSTPRKIRRHSGSLVAGRHPTSRKRTLSLEPNQRVLANTALATDTAIESSSEDETTPQTFAVAKNDEEDEEMADAKPGDNSTSRPTKPLPSKTRRPPANPSLVPVQATVPKTIAQKASARRLIVVLEQACLEAYKISSGSAARPGRDGGAKDAKYALLNCDDHQGILAKTGRDIADARPDITHQAKPFSNQRPPIYTDTPSSVF